MAGTTTLGLYQTPTSSPDYETGAGPLPLISNALATIDLKFQVSVMAASGALNAGSPPTTVEQGAVGLNATGVLAISLPAPVAGLPAVGGMDGYELLIWDETGHAHVITTATNGFNTNKHTATFAGTIGNYIQLVARNGYWWVLGNAGITLG
jgi:hypothetical protein